MLKPTNHKRELNDLETPTFDERFVYSFATEYSERGWSTLPLLGKRPAVTSWKKYQSKRPSREDLFSWHGGKAPRHTGIGIITGSVSGLVVVDCDSEDAARAWLENRPVTHLSVRTGGGGQHFYYQLPKGASIPSRVRIGEKTDLRAEGGYVVAPPSRHANGTLYAWSVWGDYSLDDVPVFREQWIGEHSVPEHRRPSEKGRVYDGPAYIKHIVAISGNGGHNATFRAACKLRDAGLTPERALAELLIWSETNAKPKWSVRELLHKVEDAYKRPSGSVRRGGR